MINTILRVSKLFRAYGLYNKSRRFYNSIRDWGFQSSFELTGYITNFYRLATYSYEVSKLFRAYGLYNSLSITIF